MSIEVVAIHSATSKLEQLIKVITMKNIFIAIILMGFFGVVFADANSDSAQALREIQEMRQQAQIDRQREAQQRQQQEIRDQMQRAQQQNWDANQKKINCDWGRC